jgi:hypothetical protein
MISMAGDISKNTIVALLVLTIIVSVVGTLVVLEKTGDINLKPILGLFKPSSGSNAGSVSSAEASIPHTTTQKGLIELNIIEPPKGNRGG